MARKNYNKPTPGHPLAIPTEDEFLVWCESKVTQFVALAHKVGSEAQKEAWMQMSWNEGVVSNDALIELRTREDAYKAFLECGYLDYLKLVEQKSPLK